MTDTAPTGARAGSPRQRDAERTRGEILDVATREFAEHGLAGARVDEIAARMRTTKRMIYYYFGSKEGLFTAVLERAYAEIRAAERQVDVDRLDPVDAARRLAELTFDHHDERPDFIRLVAIENIHRAEHLATAAGLKEAGAPAVDLLERLLQRGRAAGVFRADVDALDVHLLISSFCFFRVANRPTFTTLFDRDLGDARVRQRHRQMIGDLVVAFLTVRQPSA